MELRAQIFRAILVIAVLAAPNGEARGWGRRNQPVYRAPVYTAPSYVAPKVVVPSTAASSPSATVTSAPRVSTSSMPVIKPSTPSSMPVVGGVRPSTSASPARTDSVVRKIEYQDGQTLSVEYRTTPMADGVGVQSDRRVYAIRNSAGGWNYFKDNETYQPKVKPTVPVPSSPAKPVDTAAALEASQSSFQRYSDYQGRVAAGIQQSVDQQVTPYVKQDVRNGDSPLERNIEHNTQAYINRLPGGGVAPLSQIMKDAGLSNAGRVGSVSVDDLRNITGTSGNKNSPTLVTLINPGADPSVTQATLGNFTQAFQGKVVADQFSTIKQAGLAALDSGKKLWQQAMDPAAVTAEVLRATGLAAPATLSESLKGFGSDVAKLGSSLSGAIQAMEDYKPKVAAIVNASKVLEEAHGEYRKTLTGEQDFVVREAEYARKMRDYEQKRSALVKQGLNAKEIDERLPKPLKPSPSMKEVAGVKGQDGAQQQAPWAAGRANVRPGGLIGGKVLSGVMGQVTGSIGEGIQTAKEMIRASISKEIYGAYAKIAEEFKKGLPPGISASVGLASTEETSKALRRAVGSGNVAIQIPLKADAKLSELWLQVPEAGTPGANEKTDRVARLAQLLMKAGKEKGEPLTKEEADKIVKDELDREKKEAEAAIREKFEKERKKAEQEKAELEAKARDGKGGSDQPASDTDAPKPDISADAEEKAIRETLENIDSAVSDKAPEGTRPHHQSPKNSTHE